MRAWAASDVRWASASELALPLWRDLPRHLRGAERWAQGYVRSRVPAAPSVAYAGRASLGPAGDPIAELRALLDATAHRVAVVVDVSDLAAERLGELEALLGAPLPAAPADAIDGGERTLGVTLDARDAPRTAAVLIPHWESLPFLRPCLRSLLAHRNPRVRQTIYVLDDSSGDGSFETAQREFAGEEEIRFLRLDRPNRDREADVGLLLDMGLREVGEQYVATIDADVFATSPDWLAFPIWLAERHAASAVGMDSGLSTGYTAWGPHRWAQPPEGYRPSTGLYDNDWFVCINNLYRIMPTALAKVASEQVGYTRRNPRTGLERLWLRATRARSAYIRGGADNGVAASHFVDVNRLGGKFNIPLTFAAGGTPRDGAIGQNIGGLIFHFALSTRALSEERREVDDPGERFREWAARLQAGDESVIEEMIAASRVPDVEDPDDPVQVYRRDQQEIDRLLALYEREWPVVAS